MPQERAGNATVRADEVSLLDVVATPIVRSGAQAATHAASDAARLSCVSDVPIAAAKAKPGTAEFRSALRDALEGTTELVGVQGIYNMTPQDHSGFDGRSIVPIVVKNGRWSMIN